MIVYDVENLFANRWEYTYTVSNDTLGSDIEEFTIYFEQGLYDNLLITTPLATWDELVVDPDVILGFPEDGFFDALALGPGIAPGDDQTGFSVSFDWLGTGTPGQQAFEIVDPTTFAVMDSGFTRAIPEPGAALLFACGAIVVGTVARRTPGTRSNDTTK